LRPEPPPGWKFRSPILEQEIVFMTDGGRTKITQGEIGNARDRVGGPYGNDRPQLPWQARGYNAAPETPRQSQQATGRRRSTDEDRPAAHDRPTLPRSST
jgi:hypothetical protein